MSTLLQDKVILVTGGSSGLGRAAALALARAGASVVIADIDVAGGRSAVAAVARAGGQASFLATDARDTEQIQRTLDYVMRRYGQLDGAFNSAGVLEGAFVPMAELQPSTWDRTMAVNLRGLWLCMRLEIPLMLERGGGVIVNHASLADPYGNERVGAASMASQHGVLGLTRAAALEYADRNIRIEAICPGTIDDAVTGQGIFGMSSQRVGPVRALRPAGRLGTGPEVADAVVRLFCDSASSVTGRALPIAGSRLAP